MRGNVKLINGRTKVPVKLRQDIDVKQIISIPEQGMLMLLNQQERKLYTINHAVTGSVRSLLENERTGVKALSNQYLKYLLAQMRGRGSIITETVCMQRTASAYRDADSLLMVVDSLETVERNDSVR